jgi:hypothetical protein
MLTRLQRLWFTFVAAVVVLSLAGAVLADTESTVPAALPALLVVAFGAAAVAGVLAVDRGLMLSAPDDDTAAGEEVRARLALQIAIAQAPTLLAFALTFALGPPWVVLVGGAMSVGALLRVRPTRSRLEELEGVWQRAGSEASVLRLDERT